MEAAEANITKEFLEEHLNAKVESFSITAGSNVGDNYMCVIYAIDIILKNGERKYLVMKAFPNHPARQEFLKMINVFTKEVEVYEQLIPALKTLDPNFKFAFAPYISGKAIDYKAAESDTKGTFKFLDNYLLMTDMRKTFGFKMADRRKGMDFEHAKLVIIELAKLHACSWIYKQKNGLKFLTEKFPFLIDDMFANDNTNEQFSGVMQNFTTNALNHIKEELGPNSPAFKGVEKLASGSLDDLTEQMKIFLSPGGIDEKSVENLLRVKPELDENYNSEPWLVGNHGDCWVNNMLFRYKIDMDGEKPEEVILLDLQIVREACPTTDLTYFFVSSTSYQMREKHEAEWLEIYYNEFIRICELFSVQLLPGFTLSTLKRRYRRAKIFGFFMGIPLLQIVLQDPTEAVNLDELSGETKNMGDMFDAAVNNSKKHGLLQEQLGGLAQELYNDGVV